MVDFDLFSFVKLSFPDGWEKEEPEMIPDAALNMGGNIPEVTLINASSEAGNLTIKFYQFDMKEAAQKQHLLNSVYAETEKEEIAPAIYCGLEELRGEDEGEEVAVTRWLVTATQSDEKFTLITFSYSVALAELSSDGCNADIHAIENAIKQAHW